MQKPTNKIEMTFGQKFLKKSEALVHPGVACVFGIVTAGLSGFLALHFANPDQGRVITVAEGIKIREAKMERLRNNPHIPQKTKEFALQQMKGPRYSSEYKPQ